MITYNTDGVKMPKIRKRETTAWIKAVAASYGRKTGEVGYMFVDDEKILEVNREYLGHDYYTDIITFDYDEGDTINGDLVISLDRNKRQGTRRTRDNGGRREQGSGHARRNEKAGLTAYPANAGRLKGRPASYRKSVSTWAQP